MGNRQMLTTSYGSAAIALATAAIVIFLSSYSFVLTFFATFTIGYVLTSVTTIAAAIIMLFTVINFFQKFALILFMTIIQATVGSFILFLTLTDCIGPSNPTYLVDLAKEKLFGRK